MNAKVGTDTVSLSPLGPRVCVQERLAVEAPKRHKVSVHVLSREMDSCEYLLVTCRWRSRLVQGQADRYLTLCVCVPGPVVGEFPAQNDVNLAPAPSLPQVMIIFIILNTSCSLQKRKITDSQCLSHQT